MTITLEQQARQRRLSRFTEYTWILLAGVTAYTAGYRANDFGEFCQQSSISDHCTLICLSLILLHGALEWLVEGMLLLVSTKRSKHFFTP